VSEAGSVPEPEAWSIYLRRALLRLPPGDVRLLDRELHPLATLPSAAVSSYGVRPRR
jgi:hypothetical protein